MNTQKIRDLLFSLGIGRQYLGYSITAKSVEMVLRDENCLLCVKQGILMPIAAERN